MQHNRRTLAFAYIALATLGGCKSASVAVDSGPLVDPVLASEVGTWTGVRRRSSDGNEEALTVHVRPVLGGAALVSELEVTGAGSTYRGLALDTFDVERGVWLRTYVNPVRGVPVRLEATATGHAAIGENTFVLRGTPNATGRASENRVERIAADLRRATVSRTEDGGATWAPLFVDEMRRTDVARVERRRSL